MARIRMIKPDFFIDDKIGEITVQSRLLFIGLWCLADRNGRLDDNSKKIKVQIFPYDNFQCEKLLDELKNKKFISRYSVSGNKYIQINNFNKHQHPHHTEAKSIIPSFNGDITVSSPLEDGRFTENTDTDTDTDTDKSSCASQNDARESDDQKNQKDEHRDERTSNSDMATTPCPRRQTILSSHATTLFEKFWEAYPKKRSRGDAEKAWKTFRPSELLVRTMLIAIEQAKKTDVWQREEGQYIPYPATWLRAKGWMDELQTKTVSPPNTVTYQPRPDPTPEQQEKNKLAAKKAAELIAGIAQEKKP